MGTSYSHFEHLVPDDVKYDVDDATFAQIRFENGATIVLETTWALNLPGDNYIKIAGTKAERRSVPLHFTQKKMVRSWINRLMHRRLTL